VVDFARGDRMPTRREFLETAARATPALGGMAVLGGYSAGASVCSAAFAASALDPILKTAPVARYWTSVEKAGASCALCHERPPVARAKPPHERGLVQCLLCAQRCTIREGGRGSCRARMNVGGELRSLVYGRPIAMHVDPIEKKPFNHFLPGRTAFSLGTAGCPLHCKFCQNWEISQSSPEDHSVDFLPPDRIVEASAAQNAPIVAFTYDEPTVFTEYMLDIARAARVRGLRPVLVSCGFMNEAPLDEMCDVLAGIKIDLKGFSDAFYRDVSSAALAPVLRSIKQIRRRGVHLEIVNLVVPTLNDSEGLLTELAGWVMGELGGDVPVHFTRFHPDYQLLNLPPTPVATLERAREIAMGKGIHYVYVGNVPGHPGNNTYCPKCKEVVIRRSGFFVVEMNVKNGQCAHCRYGIPGVWS
jgi:pyruvate formate lyase activating enzyme